jgi:hypothetical protein
VYIQIIGTTEADAQAQQAAGPAAHQRMIDGLVAEGKYLWQAFQVGAHTSGLHASGLQWHEPGRVPHLSTPATAM